MSHRYLLVDFENVPKVDLAALPDDVTVPFFFGASQKSVSKDFLKTALKLGPRFVPVDIEGQGKNALDFHIAFYLGEYLAKFTDADCVILSRDKGFDPLVKHLVGRGFRVRRVASIGEAFAPASGRHVPARADTGRQDAGRGRTRTKPAAALAPNIAESVPADVLLRARASLVALPARNRPRKRQGLVKHLVSGLGRRHPELLVQRVVDELIREGVLQEAGGQMTYRL
jgi:hypothetical protein